MTLRDEHIRAARDALELAGELVSYTDTGKAARDIQARLAIGVMKLDEQTFPQRITALRVISDDVAPLSKAARFTRANGQAYVLKEIISDDGITILAEVGKVAGT
ncbi:MAG TPA: hypothetical protein VNR18_13440 [Hyphomicrobiales bacterium]|nr:hypothetical protein [Hyphomicrobiales bacterium]